MKHNIKSIVWGLFMVLLLSSCDSFLDMQPSNSGNADGAIKTVDDAEIVLNGIMSSLTSSSYYGRNFFMYGDAKGGDFTIYSAGRGLDALYSFNHTPTSGSYSGFWTNGYYCILQINSLLQNIEILEAEGETGFDFCKGQTLTLRALIYFDLVRLYGLPYNYNKASYGVPLTLTAIESDTELSRSSVQEVYNQIVIDLAEAKNLLSSDKSAKNGYISYYANVAIDARVKLYMENYDDALTDAEEIINNEEYTLYQNSDWVSSWQNEFGSESILELGIYPSESDLGSSSLGYYLMQKGQLSGAMGFFLASDYFLNCLGEDSTDVRWGVMDNDEYWVEYGISRKGACYKYMGGVSQADGSFPGDGKSTATSVNIKMIRLSEIYLIAAEAALHSTTSDAEKAATYLNEIRKRAPSLVFATASTITDEMILDERRKELFGEGQRFFDMMRMDQTITYNDDFQDVPVSTRETTIDRTFEKIVLPISQDEINANSAIENEQNEAYK